MVNPVKKRSPLWYELPLLFSIIGGLIAYFMIRKDDPKKARNCLLLSVIIIVVPLVIFLSFQIPLGTDNPFYVVASGSMMPELQVYDVAVVQGHSTIEDVQIGDIIVFNRPSGTDRVILHRVVSIINEMPAWLVAITTVITAANGITALTPSKVDDKVMTTSVRAINIGLKVLNVLSVNIGRNKNKDS